MNSSSHWIWPAESSGKEYNLMVVFRKDFSLEEVPQSATVKVTADTRYRLKVNGQWLADGPARAYPEHYSYDIVDVSYLLKPGINRIEADVRFFGCGTFHQMPQTGGFRLQLETEKGTVLGTDKSWQAAIMPQWIRNTPKISPQQGPYETFNATESQTLNWQECRIVDPEPWSNLSARNVPMLTRREALGRQVLDAFTVPQALETIALSPQRLKFPENFTINRHNLIPMLLAVEVDSPETQTVEFYNINLSIFVNGKAVSSSGNAVLNKGKNFLLAHQSELCGHYTSIVIGWNRSCNLKTQAVRYFIFDDLSEILPDIPYLWANTKVQQMTAEYFERCGKYSSICSLTEFIQTFPACGEPGAEALLQHDGPSSVLQTFPKRTSAKVDNLQAIIHPDDRDAVIHPVSGQDVRLILDLGQQNVGYWNFTLFAPENTIVDLTAVEYITPEGMLQDPGDWYLNSMRYICRNGLNRYTSYQRRSGRYLVCTIRNFDEPVRFRNLRLVESTYPVVQQCSFRCSDPRLDKIYDISAHTLKLCMEDTFTDCPLYEQTYWIGDARSEGLFAMVSLGAYDIVRHCLELAGESQNHVPLIACQAPSSWVVQIPSHGLMWALAVEDYYLETGDLDFIRQIWDRLSTLMNRAQALRSPVTGLVKTLDWNLLEWSETKTEYPTMLYNSQLLIGALQSAGRLAALLDKKAEQQQFAVWEQELIAAVNQCWSERHLAYYSSLDANDRPVEEFAIHTSIFAYLFDAMPPGAEAAVKANILTPRPGLIQIGSPFFTIYLHQALRKLEMPGESVSILLRDYLQMLDCDATTVWESFPGAVVDRMEDKPFPTRSHCHAWSSVPVELFPGVILGLKSTASGNHSFTVSPYPGNLTWASGSRMTAQGKISVSWKIDRSQNKMQITVKCPETVQCSFQSNSHLKDFEIEFICIAE